MDGVTSLSGVCFVGATNLPNLVDEALLRPGRMDHHIFVPLPDDVERCQLFRNFFDSVRSDGEDAAVAPSDDDLRMLVSASAGFSGADVQGACRTALLEARTASLDAGDQQKGISVEAVRNALFSAGPTKYDEKALSEFMARTR